MPNWDKLNKELFDVMDSLSPEQWNTWLIEREENKIARKKQEEKEMHLHLMGLYFKSFEGTEYLSEKKVQIIPVNEINHFEKLIEISAEYYSFAA